MNDPVLSAQSPEYVPSADPGISPATDRSVRAPVLLFAGSAVFWIFWSSLFWLVSAMQAADPNVFSGISWLSYGRVYPVFQNTFVYGWASSAAIAIGFWLIARLSRSVPRHSSIPVYAAILWNIGLLIGVLSILAGAGNGKDFLEFPGHAAFCLFWAFVLADIWAVLVYANRTSRSLYISEWYVVTAFLCFPWMYATATILLNGSDLPGISQSIVHYWFVGCLFSLWLAPMALAVAYYLIPKIVGNSIASDRLAQLGFWGWIFLSGWIGTTFMIGGPVPAWMVTFGIVARVLSVIAVLAVALNLHLTMRGNFEALSWNPALRFVVVGAMAFAVFGVEASLLSFRTVAGITQFTAVVSGNWQFGLFAFISLIFFGAFYYIIPRVLDRHWLVPGLVRTHFWCGVIGVCILIFNLTVGGLIQGLALQDSKVSMDAVGDLMRPFLAVQIWAVLAIVVGNLAFVCAVLTIFLLPAPSRRNILEQEVPLFRNEEVTVA